MKNNTQGTSPNPPPRPQPRPMTKRPTPKPIPSPSPPTPVTPPSPSGPTFRVSGSCLYCNVVVPCETTSFLTIVLASFDMTLILHYITPLSSPTTYFTQCPSPSLVGCTATDPTNPINECDAVGELCAGSQFDHCCFDQCPRKYCTAKEAPP